MKIENVLYKTYTCIHFFIVIVVLHYNETVTIKNRVFYLRLHKLIIIKQYYNKKFSYM